MKGIVLSIILLLVASCSSQRPKGKTEAEVLFREAKRLKEASRFIMATEKLNALRSQFPYSYYATHAELLQADILFDQDNFVEAASAYILFKDFHPKFKDMDYVIWKVAESFYNQLPSTYDRDLTSGKEAIKYYQELLRIKKNSKYQKDAKDKIKKCKNMLEQKELYIADFYFKTDVYDAARYRYLDILKHFRTTQTRDHSMLRIVESSLELKENNKCALYYKRYNKKISQGYRERLKETYTRCLNPDD